MRRWATWLLVTALAALGSVAIADALRGSPRETVSPPSGSSATETTRDERPSTAMGGVLYYSAKTQACRLAGIALPDLRDADAPDLESCRFSLSPDATVAFPWNATWSPQGGLVARERGRLIELASTNSKWLLRFPGHAPAFKPDGTFTYARGHAVVEWSTSCPSGARLFTLPDDNATVRCRRIVAGFDPYEPVLSLAWMSNTRMAVITKPSEWVLTIREGRLRTSTLGFGQPLSDLQVSPRGNFVAARAEGRGGLLVLRPDGLAASLPPLTNPRAITWSPDERWTAVATENSVFVFPTNTGDASVFRLPIIARDLAWR